MEQNSIKLHDDLIKFMFTTMNLSKAEKRKVAAILFDNMGKIINSGFNYNLDNIVCENNNNETFDTVVHAEQSCIFNYFKELGLHQSNTGRIYNMLISYSPCIECAKQIVLSDIINNIFIYEEHEVNFRKSQYIDGSLSPLELLLKNNIDVYIFNKESNTFDKVIIKPKTVCIYHSKDLDGFMSRYLVEKFWLNSDVDFVGYNYESDANWMHEKYNNYIFVDITPPLDWLSKNILIADTINIFDHHRKTISNICNSLYLSTKEDSISYIHENKNICIHEPKYESISACKLLYQWLSITCKEKIHIFHELVEYISLYDTWHFTDLNEKDKNNLLNIIESLKTLNYEEFSSLLENINYNTYSEIIYKLNISGSAIRINQNNEAIRMLDNSLYHIYVNGENSMQLIIGNLYPTYELECILRKEYNTAPLIYVSYSINLQKNNVVFSVRHYPIQNKKSLINALKIAENFEGGGHPDAAGFTLTISEFSDLLNSKFQTIKNLINNCVK